MKLTFNMTRDEAGKQLDNELAQADKQYKDACDERFKQGRQDIDDLIEAHEHKEDSLYDQYNKVISYLDQENLNA